MNDDEDYEDYECDHMDYEADILTGIATCSCGHRWMQTNDERERERQRQVEYDRLCEQWAREERSLANRLRRLAGRVRNMWRRPEDHADGIPF